MGGAGRIQGNGGEAYIEFCQKTLRKEKLWKTYI